MLTPDEVIAFIASRNPETVFAALGITISRYGADESVVELPITHALYQHAGIVHGGIYVLLMESAASVAAAFAVDVTTSRIAGQEISASHVRPSTTGTLVGRARPLHSGRTAIVYACEVENDGKLVSTGRCTIAVRPIA